MGEGIPLAECQASCVYQSIPALKPYHLAHYPFTM